MSTRIVRYKIPSVLSAAWAKGFGDITPNSTSQDIGMFSTTDAFGNIYWGGYFRGTIDLGGTANERLTAVGNPDIFIAKLDSTGAHVWSRRFTTIGQIDQMSIVVAPDGQHIYVGSRFTSGSLLKLTITGDTVWFRGPTMGFPRIAVDSEGNIVATGVMQAPFANPLDFGNGVTLYSVVNDRDAFLVKYDASGNCLWGKTFGNSGDRETGLGICVDRVDNTIVIGGWSQLDIYLNGTGNVSGLPLDTPHYYKTLRSLSSFAFLAKFSSDGNTVIWSKALGLGVSTDPSSMFTRIEDLALDGERNVIVGGHYNTKSDFGAGAYTASTAVYRHGFVAKYNGSNGNLVWVQPINGSHWLFVSGVAIGPQNSVVATGYFFGVSDFGGRTLSNPHNVPNYNVFLVKYSSAGVLDATVLRQFGSTALADGANGVSVGGDYANVTGYYQATVDFNGTSLTSNGGLDGFLMRIPIAV